jgi:cell division ATPase FtsA
MADVAHDELIAFDFDSQFLYVAVGSRDATLTGESLATTIKYPHSGMRRGVATDRAELARVTRFAVRTLIQKLGYRPTILIGINPTGLTSKTLSHTVSLTDTESVRIITTTDIDVLLSSATEKLLEQHINKELLNAIPLQYAIDGTVLPIGTIPIGSQARNLTVRIMGIVTQSQHRDDCVDIVNAEDCQVLDTVATPLAASYMVSDPRQRMMGCAVLYIASETTTLVLFANSNPVNVQTFDIGIEDIIGDIALGFQIDIAIAKQLLADPESVTEKGHSKKKFLDIVNARYSDFAEIVNKTLMQAGWQGLLPAGIIIVPTTSMLSGLDDVLRTQTQLPAKIWQGEPGVNQNRRKARDISGIGGYALACVYAKQSMVFFPKSRIIKNVIRDQVNSIKTWFNGLLPE